MIKRPLNSRFTQAVLDGRKFTTIRNTPWPVGTPIMLYNWSGAAYRSKQIDVAPIIVLGFWQIQIAHRTDGKMFYAYGMENSKSLHETEGFDSGEEMDEWFRPLVKPGQLVTKFLHRFRLMERGKGECYPSSLFPGCRVKVGSSSTYKGRYGTITQANGMPDRWFVAIDDDDCFAEVSFYARELIYVPEDESSGATEPKR